ncbi:MAG: RNA polymerase sigma factor [Massiliimalia sp.]
MWEELYEAYFSELITYGTKMIGSKELTEDLVQETFIRAMINYKIVSDLSPSQQRAWLYRTFKNLFFDWYRRSALENQYTQNFELENEAKQGLQEIENAIILQSISPEDRTLFQLRYLDGYTAVEISEMMNIPPGTVRSRLSRCRKHLKEIFKS